MSVITDSNQYACSSRIRGIFRYLLQKTGQHELREKLEQVLSPESLVRGGEADEVSRAMIKGSINESLRMSLLTIDTNGSDNTVTINPSLSDKARNKTKGDYLLPQTLTSLLINGKSEADRNLGILIAWFLTQDAYSAPGNWAEFQDEWVKQGGANLLQMNNARYSQFDDWICFLGFAWRHNLQGKNLLTPDPTNYLKGAIKELFDVTKQLPIGEFLSKLGKHCPVFETGVFRVEIENMVRFRETEQHLSSTTSLALFRLDNEKIIKLSKRSDAPVFTFPDGQQVQSFTHISLI